MKTWFITGCSSGFGYEIAMKALEAGNNVVVTARNTDKLTDFQKFGDNVLALPLDVTNQESIDTAAKQALEWKGGVDVLVNNAGIGAVGAIEETTASEYKRLFDTNVFGLVEVTKAFLPSMREKKSGHVINISSVAGIITMPGFGPYCMTKFAVEAFTETLAQEAGPLGIKATVIEPGAFKTKFVGHNLGDMDKIADYDATVGPTRGMIASMAEGAKGDPEKLAKAIVDVANMDQPPLRLILGEDAMNWAIPKVDELKKQLLAHEDLSKSMNFD